MDNFYNDDLFEKDISIEEFDHITDGVEDHVFSDRYLAGKEKMMKTYTQNKKAKTTGMFPKIAAAALAIVVASPFVVNAAMGGELFNRIWGNEGKTNVTSHQVKVVESGKIDDKGNPVTNDVTMPKIEYVSQDPEVAARLLAGKYTTNPVSTTIGDTTITVETVVRDGMGIVVAYTVERPGGVNCFNYSQFDNEAKGAWFNEDQNIMFGFDEGVGKIWVDLARSTDTKLYCYEYLCDGYALFGPETHSPITDHITFSCQEYTDTRANIEKANNPKGDTSYIKDSKSVKIPVADKLDSKVFKSADNGTIKISPIAMQWDSTGGTASKGEALDSVKSLKITNKDGSEYVVYNDNTASYGYLCGNDTGFIVLFNRLVDTDNIAKIKINDTDYTLK
ncbi:MAG: hypothetical protein J5623_07480 [Clostridiales bacterium]|nr:hypothetical protein [Clostridiales bacterium]